MDSADRAVLRAYVRFMDRSCSRSVALNLGLYAVTLTTAVATQFATELSGTGWQKQGFVGTADQRSPIKQAFSVRAGSAWDPNQGIRKPLLYPAELRDRGLCSMPDWHDINRGPGSPTILDPGKCLRD